MLEVRNCRELQGNMEVKRVNRRSKWRKAGSVKEREMKSWLLETIVKYKGKEPKNSLNTSDQLSLPTPGTLII